MKEERWREEAVCLQRDLNQMTVRLKECKPGGDVDCDQDQGHDHDQGLDQDKGHDQVLDHDQDHDHDQGLKRGEDVETELKEEGEEGDVNCRTEEKDSSYKTLKMVKLAPKLNLEKGKVEVEGPLGLENLLIDFD